MHNGAVSMVFQPARVGRALILTSGVCHHAIAKPDLRFSFDQEEITGFVDG